MRAISENVLGVAMCKICNGNGWYILDSGRTGGREYCWCDCKTAFRYVKCPTCDGGVFVKLLCPKCDEAQTDWQAQHENIERAAGKLRDLPE